MKGSGFAAKTARRPITSAETLQRALALHKQGKLQQAAKLYNQIIRVAPDDYQTLHFAGVLNFQQGQPEKADELLRRALAANPNYIEALSSRGIVLREMKRLEEALACYDRAATLKPDFVEALYNRGNLLLDVGLYPGRRPWRCRILWYRIAHCESS